MERPAVVRVLQDVAVRVLGVAAGDAGEQVAFADLGLDSLGVVEYALRLEQVLDVELPEEEVTEATTFGALADVVLLKLSVRGPAAVPQAAPQQGSS